MDDDPIGRDIERDVRRGHIPCCMGCVMYGHRVGCCCIPAMKREVTVPLLAMKRLLDGKATDGDRTALTALVMRELRS